MSVTLHSVSGTVLRSRCRGYDAAGRTTSVTSSAGATTLTYDFEGRATSIVGPGVSQFNVFNGLDTRVGSTTNSVARTFLRDGAYVTDPVLTDGAATYTPGISERRGATTTFLHSGLKNADAQSNPGQSLTAARHYDAFGNLLGASGSWHGPFGYAGAFGYQEDATGLMLLGHRLYDPSTGRFLTRDPIKDGRNWYAYANGDPVRFVDPDGLIAWVPIFVAAIVIIDIIDTANDVKDIIEDPTDPRRYIAPIIGIVDPTPGNIGKRIGESAKRIGAAVEAIADWIGPGATIRRSKQSDLVIVSVDEKRVIHFDLTNPYPHQNPHVDIIEKEVAQVRVYPVDVDPR